MGPRFAASGLEAMANSNKQKGDMAELDAIRVLVGLTPDLIRPKARRMLGAGRKDDVGDLDVYDDVAVQVRVYAKDALESAIRSAAADAVVQAANGDRTYALGMVPVPRASNGTVRWLACVDSGEWPTDIDKGPTTVGFKSISTALAWRRDDTGPHGYLTYPRTERIAMLPVVSPPTPVNGFRSSPAV